MHQYLGTPSTAFTTSAGGAATVQFKGITGIVTAIEIDGTLLTAGFDVTLTNTIGADLLRGTGANLSAGVNRLSVSDFGIQQSSNETLTLNITNGGATKGGTAVLHWRE